MKIKKKKGFTIIELLIVVSIIAILAAIAIPQFSAYRIKGCNSAAQSDLKNIVTSEEAYFVDNQVYQAVGFVTGPADLNTTDYLPGAKLSKNVTAKVIATSAADGTFYTSGTAHVQGDRVMAFESEEGFFAFEPKTAGAVWDGASVAAATTGSDFAGTQM